jgi:hypothetical protein
MPTYEPIAGWGLLTSCVGLALLVGLTVGCQAPPPVNHLEQSRSYAKAQDALWDEILLFLASHGIVPVRADPARGRLEAERHAFEDMGWASCELAWVTDKTGDSQRPTRASPVARDLRLWIVLRKAGHVTEVAIAARFSEQQIDPYRNQPFTQPCRSNGVLEKALLDAL